MTFFAPLLIAAKRDGAALSEGEINWLLEAYQRGDVAEEQMSAMLMAIFFRGLERDHTAALGECVAHLVADDD